jgi:hypothetical protein
VLKQTYPRLLKKPENASRIGYPFRLDVDKFLDTQKDAKIKGLKEEFHLTSNEVLLRRRKETEKFMISVADPIDS